MIQSTPVLLVAAVALLATACATEPQHVGRRPLGDRRPISERDATEPVQRARGRSARDASPDARIERLSTQGQHLDADVTVTGIYTTKIYHHHTCELIEDVPAVDRLTFVSPYDAVDAQYAPCRVCDPGR